MWRGIIATIGILVIVTSFTFVGYKASAQMPFIFGGFITKTFFCSCSGNFLLTLSAPTPGQWVWYPGTPQFANNQLPRAGVWTLGLYKPGGVCLIWVGKACAPFGVPAGTIGPITGTSF